MRDSGLLSTGPKAAKSTAGMVGSPPPPAPGARAAAPPAPVTGDREVLTNPLTSSWVMRLLNPLPFTRVRSTPSSRANLRTDGPACAREKPGSLIGGRSVASAMVGRRRHRLPRHRVESAAVSRPAVPCGDAALFSAPCLGARSRAQPCEDCLEPVEAGDAAEAVSAAFPAAGAAHHRPNCRTCRCPGSAEPPAPFVIFPAAAPASPFSGRITGTFRASCDNQISR